MKAVRLNELGGPEKLHVEEVPQPQPAPGEVLVKIKRAAFNRRDVFITQGLYPGIELPKTLGSDGTGEVAALGAGVSGPALGTAVVIDPEIGWDEKLGHAHKGAGVLGMPREGTFAEYVVVPAQNVYPKPAALSDDEAAAIPLAGMTAYRAVFTRGQIRPEDVVLITGIGGGVQTFVLLYAKHAGARAIVTSGSDEKLERAQALGADVAINYKTNPDWHKEARQAAGDGGPTLIVDSTGGETLSRCLDIARHAARVVIYGGTAGDAKIRPFSIFWKHLSVLGTSMGSPSDFAGMLELFEGGLRPVVDRVYPMNEVAAAAERVAHSEQFGKVVLAIA
ncbi:MAG TPA: zinc-binding dehydrogenase [Candidatus Baltobacteraceae bacterium]|nr:zinc-binding dehydrogenase [Candidatus Baltobacteraceae bacterium]